MLVANGALDLSIEVPHALSAPLNRCVARDAAGARRDDPFISNVQLESRGGRLYVMALVGNFPLDMPAGGDPGSAIRYQLDDAPSVLVSYGRKGPCLLSPLPSLIYAAGTIELRWR